MSGQSEFDARMERLGQLLEEFEQRHTPSELDPARALLTAVLAVHQSALSRLLSLLRDREHQEVDLGPSLLSTLQKDPVIAALLAVHGLGPESKETTNDVSERGLVPVSRLQVKNRGVTP